MGGIRKRHLRVSRNPREGVHGNSPTRADETGVTKGKGMKITGTSQRTLDQLNRMEALLRRAGVKTEYGFNDQQTLVSLTWERSRKGCVIERGHVFALMSHRTGNLRFHGGQVWAYGVYTDIKTYRDAWNAVNLAVALARTVKGVA